MIAQWKNGRIKDLIESLESGVSVNGEDRVPSDDEPAVLKVSSVTMECLIHQPASRLFIVI